MSYSENVRAEEEDCVVVGISNPTCFFVCVSVFIYLKVDGKY